MDATLYHRNTTDKGNDILSDERLMLRDLRILNYSE